METLKRAQEPRWAPIGWEGPGKWESFMEESGGGQTSSGRTAVGAVGHWELAPPSFLSPPPPAPARPPAPPTAIEVPCACARGHRLPNIASSLPFAAPLLHPLLVALSSPRARARARMTHSPPPRSLVTRSHFRVRDNVDSRARGRDGGGATGLLSGGREGRGGASASVPLSDW